MARFPPEATSVGDARSFVRSELVGLASDAMVDVIVLLTSEVVTNAVVHGRSGTEVTVTRSSGGVRVAVTDRSARLPALAPTDGLGEGGRGLLLLSELADSWGVEPAGEGKAVWFCLALG